MSVAWIHTYFMLSNEFLRHIGIVAFAHLLDSLADVFLNELFLLGDRWFGSHLCGF